MRTPLSTLRANPWSTCFLVLALTILLAGTWRLTTGPLFPASAEFTGTLTHAQRSALKERGCTLVGRSVKRLPTEFYCRDPRPGVYPARQLVESLPRTGWVLTDPAFNPPAKPARHTPPFAGPRR